MKKSKKNKTRAKKTTNDSFVSTGKKMIKMLIVIFALLVIVVAALIYINIGDEPAETSLSETLIPDRPPVVEFTHNGYLHFISSTGDTISKIDIELVNNDYERSLGLMYRENMNEDQGMLFIFPRVEPMGFWMKNTAIPLDIIFIDADKMIAKIHHNTTPYSDSTYESIIPCKYVVETIAGYAESHKISEGDKVSFVIETLD